MRVFLSLKSPYGYHVVVHPPEFLLGGLEGIRRRIEFICFEALIGESDFKGLVIFLSIKRCKLLWSS